MPEVERCCGRLTISSSNNMQHQIVACIDMRRVLTNSGNRLINLMVQGSEETFARRETQYCVRTGMRSTTRQIAVRYVVPVMQRTNR